MRTTKRQTTFSRSVEAPSHAWPVDMYIETRSSKKSLEEGFCAACHEDVVCKSTEIRQCQFPPLEGWGELCLSEAMDWAIAGEKAQSCVLHGEYFADSIYISARTCGRLGV